MIYEASLYYDKINAREKPRSGFGSQEEQWRVFETEGEARAFIRLRAQQELAEAEKALKRAKARVHKCEKKFCFRLADARGVLASPPQHDGDK